MAEEHKKRPDKKAAAAQKPAGKKPAKAKADASAAKPQQNEKASPEPKDKPAAKKARPQATPQVPRLKRLYHEKVIKELQSAVGYKNVWQVPRMEKIVLNIGIGNAKDESNVLKGALDDLAVITGQKAVVTYAKKPISNFKIRLKYPVGVKVTLRRNHMW